MPLPSEGELSIKDLQEEATIPMGNTNDFVEMGEVYAIANFDSTNPQNITLADDFYGEEVNLTATSIGVNPTLLTFPSSGGALTTNLTINGYALMIGKPGWLSTEKTYLSTNEAGTLRFTATENNVLGASPRNKAIQFIGKNSYLYATLIVSQSGNPVDITLTPSNSQTIAATTTTFTQDVTVTNPLQVFGSVTGSGFTLPAPTVTNLGSTSRYRFTLTQSANTGGARQAQLNFDISGSNFIQQRSITHTQSAFAASISVTPGSFDFDINGEVKQFVITSNINWEAYTSGDTGFETSVTSASSGFSTTTKTGTNSTGTAQTYNIWVKATDNSAGGTNDRSATLVVRQNPWSGGGAFDNSNLTQDGNPLPTFSYTTNGGVYGFAVAASGTITAPSTNVAGATITSISYRPSNEVSGTTFNTFTTPATKTRYADVSLRVPNQPSVWSNYNQIVTGTESATQNALQEILQLSTNDSAAAAGGSMQFTVTTEPYFSTNWQGEISSRTPPGSWVTVGASAVGSGNGSFYVGLDPNYSGGYRYFTVRVYKVGQSSLFDEIDFSQYYTTPPVQKPTYTISPTSKTWTYGQYGSSNAQTFTVSWNGGGAPASVSFYIASSDFGFVQTDPNVPISYGGGGGGPTGASWSGTGVSSWSIGVYPIASNAGNIPSRTGTLNVSMTNSGGTTDIPDASLEQEGQITWSTSPSGTTITRDYTTGNFNVTLTTNLAWSATLTNDSFASFALSGGNTQTGSGNKTFLITHGTNSRTGDLTGTLVLTSTTAGTSESKTYNLVQNPQPPELLFGFIASAMTTNTPYNLSPSTNGQSYALVVKHSTAQSGTVTFDIFYESTSHVGISTTSSTSSGAGSNYVTATVGGTAVTRYANFASNSSNVLREAVIRITSSIATNEIILNSSYGSSSSGCILKGTKVKLSDGSLVKVEQLSIGQTLSSKLVDTMPIKNEEEVLSWVSEDLSISDDEVSLVSITPYIVDNIFNFNTGLIKTSADHLHLVKKQNLYQVVKAENLVVGDYLIKEDGTEVEIVSKRLETGYYTVYKLDVEENDLFIANGLLTHNAKGTPLEP